MASPPVCPSCGSLAVGEKCGSCGAAISKAEPQAAGLESQPKHRQAAAYLKLEESEQAVLHAASRIFAAFITSGAVNEGNQNVVADRSVQLATRMAVVVEKYIQSDNEDW